MKVIVRKIIYLLISFVYISVGFATPLSLDWENNSRKVEENSIHVNQLTFDYSRIPTLNVMSINSANTWKNDIASIHQYDDRKYAKTELNFSNTRNSSSVVPAAYSYRNNSNNEREVLGYLPYWELSKYQSIDYSKLSTIAYFSLTSDDTGAWVKGYRENGVWYDDGGYVGFNSATFTNMVNKAHAQNVKVVLLVKNFDPYSIRQIVNNTNSAGDRLINNIVSTVASKGLDGVNIDFEYVPKLDRDTVTDGLRSAFALWHDKLADRMHSEFPNSHVSTDVFGSSGVSYSIYDMQALGNTSLDYIAMMTYDYITTSCWNGKKIAPMSPLYGNNLYGTPNWNTSSHLQAGANKAGSRKILMGIPYYGIDFQVQTAYKDSYNAYVDYPNCNATIEVYASIVASSEDAYHNASTMRWNNTEKARWYVYKYGSAWRHGYYDDELSLAAKYDFVRSANLGGVAIWVIGYDNNAPELYNVIREKFQKVPFYVHFEYGISNERISNILTASKATITEDMGNSTYKLSPVGTISGEVIKNLKLYREVVDVRFDLEGNNRSLN